MTSTLTDKTGDPTPPSVEAVREGMAAVRLVGDAPGSSTRSSTPADAIATLPRPKRGRKAASEPSSDVSLFDLFVILAAATISLAVGTALTLHAGFEMLSAAILSILLYAGLVCGHILIARSQPARASGKASGIRADARSGKADAADAVPVTATKAVHPSIEMAGPSDAEARASYERLQALVAKMAADVKAADLESSSGTSLRSAAIAPSTEARALPIDTHREDAQASAVPQTIDAKLDTAVATLNSFLTDMKAGGSTHDMALAEAHVAPQPAANNNALPPELPKRSIDLALLAGAFGQSVAGAISGQRLRMYLEPINGLIDAKPHHLEVTMRLVGEDGVDLDLGATRALARQAGLSPALDALKLPRAARIARQFATAGKGAVLTSLEGETLADREFRESASLALAGTQSARVLLTFSQADVRAFGPIHWQTLLEMVRLGVRFAVDGITDLDMDFEGLRALGFEFVKLDAATYLEGLPGEHGVLPAKDVVSYFTTAGLEPIVEGITEATQLIHVQGTGARLGVGQLFGGPRPVRAEVLEAEARAA